jgi:RNA-binding protein Luc7-like 2
MDLGSCARTHSPKVKTEYTLLLAKAEEEKDTQTVAELNRLRVEYENTVCFFLPLPCVSICSAFG